MSVNNGFSLKVYKFRWKLQWILVNLFLCSWNVVRGTYACIQSSSRPASFACYIFDQSIIQNFLISLLLLAIYSTLWTQIASRERYFQYQFFPCYIYLDLSSIVLVKMSQLSQLWESTFKKYGNIRTTTHITSNNSKPHWRKKKTFNYAFPFIKLNQERHSVFIFIISSPAASAFWFISLALRCVDFVFVLQNGKFPYRQFREHMYVQERRDTATQHFSSLKNMKLDRRAEREILCWCLMRRLFRIFVSSLPQTLFLPSRHSEKMFHLTKTLTLF